MENDKEIVELESLFKEIHYNNSDDPNADRTATIYNYFGTESVVFVPQKVGTYRVSGFILNNNSVNASIEGVKVVYLPKTLDNFQLFNFGGNKQFALDKIVFDGTKANFIEICGGEYRLSDIMKSVAQIVCTDGNFGMEPITFDKASYLYQDQNANSIEILVDWNSGKLKAQINYDGKEYRKHADYGLINNGISATFQFGGGNENEFDWFDPYNLRIETSNSTFRFLSIEFKYTDTSYNIHNIDFELISAEEYKQQLIINHEYYEIVNPPTCQNDGHTLYQCAGCDNSYADKLVPKLEHDYLSTKVEATCQKLAYLAWECSMCGERYEEELGGEYASHTYEIYSCTATCVLDGVTEYECSVCQDRKTEEAKAIGHGNYKNVTVTAPTCTEQGYSVGKCGRCYWTVTFDYIEATGHSYGDDGVCTKCLESQFFNFELMDDGYYVSGVKDETLQTAVINSSLNGIAVVGISNAFFDCSMLTSVTIPDSVISIGNYAFYNCNSLAEVNFAEGSKLKSIGEYAFSGCSSLTSIVIPVSVTSIGYEAFSGCGSLAEVNFAAESKLESISFKVFNGCSSLMNFVIPDSVTYIGSNAFSGCSSLTEMLIPDSVTSIDSNAFSGCSSLTEMLIPDSVTSIGSNAFSGCDKLESITVPFIGENKDESLYKDLKYFFGNSVPSSLKSVVVTGGEIGSGAFYGCSSLTSIVIPDSVTSIGTDAFRNCSMLTNFTIPNGVTSIGQYAFSGCRSLTEMLIPDSVTSIGSNAFGDCSGLTDLTIGNGVTSISYAFNGCNNIEKLTCPASAIDDILKSNLKTVVITGGDLIDNQAFLDCKTLTSVTIANTVTAIGWYAFSGCSSLTNITIPNSVISISHYAFYNCGSLAEVNFAEGSRLTSIGEYVFSDCSLLTSIVIPKGVTSIGKYAFSGCGLLTSIVIPDSVSSIGSNAFNGTAWYDNQPDGLLYAGKIAYEFKGAMSAGTTIELREDTVAIGSYAFNKCEGLNSILVPESVSSIGEYAFNGCSSLTSYNVGSNVTSIGNYAFSGCSSLAEVNFAEGSKLESIGSNAFSGCNLLKNITIPDSVITIGNYAFSGCSGLTDLTIGNGVTRIDQYAFSGCSGLTSISIPESVTFISSDAFSGCSGIQTITVSDNNTAYRSEGNCLIDITYNYLVLGCKNSVIPTDGSVTYISSNAFYGCSSLTSIVIPVSVTSIGYEAFSGCSSLASIIYNGTIEQWIAITKRDDWNFNTGDYIITFSDGTTLNKSDDV